MNVRNTAPDGIKIKDNATIPAIKSHVLNTSRLPKRFARGLTDNAKNCCKLTDNIYNAESIICNICPCAGHTKGSRRPNSALSAPNRNSL